MKQNRDNITTIEELDDLAEIARHVNAQLAALWLLNENSDQIDTLSKDTLSDLVNGMQQQLDDLADRLDHIKIQ